MAGISFAADEEDPLEALDRSDWEDSSDAEVDALQKKGGSDAAVRGHAGAFSHPAKGQQGLSLRGGWGLCRRHRATIVLRSYGLRRSFPHTF